MLAHFHMKWVPLLVSSGGTGISAGFVVVFADAAAFVKQAG